MSIFVTKSHMAGNALIMSLVGFGSSAAGSVLFQREDRKLMLRTYRNDLSMPLRELTAIQQELMVGRDCNE